MGNMALIKELSARAMVAGLIFALAYLLGCFCAASFDITVWDVGLRAVVAFAGGLMAVMVAAYPFERFTS